MYTSVDFSRRLAAFERAEAGRFGRPLGDTAFARVALSRRMLAPTAVAVHEPAAMCADGPLLLQR